MHQICQCMEEWRVISLIIRNNKESELIKQIVHIRFVQLKHLDLPHNQIQSIQSLNQVYLPVMQNLFLSLFFHKVDNNNICSLTFHLCSLSKVSNIRIDNNRIVSLAVLAISYLFGVKELTVDNTGQAQDNSLNWLAKSNFPCIQTIYIAGNRPKTNRKSRLLYRYPQARINPIAL